MISHVHFTEVEREPMPIRETDGELRVTIWDAEGKIVLDEVQSACTATKEEIDAMIGLIESGVPAHISAYVLGLPRPAGGYHGE